MIQFINAYTGLGGGSEKVDIVIAVCLTAAYIAYRFTKKDGEG